MKKLKIILGCGLLLGVFSTSAVAIARSSHQTLKEAQSVISAQYYVPVNTTNFWSDQYNIADQISNGNDTFFDPGRFFGTTRPLINTVNLNEGKTGDIRSDDFNQTGEYVSFLIGGNPNYNDGHPQNFVNLWSTDKGFNVAAEVCNDAFSDPNISCNMIFKYVQVPQEYRGKCLIYIHDGTTGNFGGVTFGDLRINQTWDDVVAAYSAHIATYALSRNNQANIDAYNAVTNYYSTNSYYTALNTALAAKTSADDGFEKLNSLTNWAFDRMNSTRPDGGLISLNFEGIISDNNIKQDGYFTAGLPANKTDNYYVNADVSGVGEDCKYRLVSSEFTLSGTGLISAKLGGATAVLELLDSNYNVLETTAIAEATGSNVLNPGFSRNDDLRHNIIANNLRFNTMSRTYLDCSEHLGKRVRVALSDARTGGEWGLAYFDEVVTYYENLPSFKLDVISQTNGEEVYHGVVKDQYVGSSSTVFGQAYSFVSSFYNVMRQAGNSVSWCSVSQSTDVQNLLTAYNALPANVKTIVDASQDYTYGKDVSSSNYYFSNVDVTTYNIGQTMAYLSGYTPVNNGGGSGTKLLSILNENNSLTWVIIIPVIIVASAMMLYFLIRRRKKAQR